MWGMFVETLAVSIITMVVVFGLGYIELFSTFLPFEISLAATFFLWGLNSVYNPYMKVVKNTFFYSVILCGVLIVFVSLGIS
jgi:hypothetical protein